MERSNAGPPGRGEVGGKVLWGCQNAPVQKEKMCEFSCCIYLLVCCELHCEGDLRNSFSELKGWGGKWLDRGAAANIRIRALVLSDIIPEL